VLILMQLRLPGGQLRALLRPEAVALLPRRPL